MTSTTDELRVFIIANDPLARAGLAALLADQPHFTVVGQVSGEADLYAELEVYRPDVVLWDLGWSPTLAPIQSGLAELRDTGGPTLALVPDAAHAAEAWSMGPRGLLLREADVGTLSATLTAVAQGLIVLAPELSVAVPLPRNQELGALLEALTPREMEVLRLLAEGLPNKSIAERLAISEHTVKFHVNGVLGKLGAQSRTEAVILATRLGLVLL